MKDPTVMWTFGGPLCLSSFDPCISPTASRPNGSLARLARPRPRPTSANPSHHHSSALPPPSLSPSLLPLHAALIAARRLSHTPLARWYRLRPVVPARRFTCQRRRNVSLTPPTRKRNRPDCLRDTEQDDTFTIATYQPLPHSSLCSSPILEFLVPPSAFRSIFPEQLRHTARLVQSTPKTLQKKIL